MIAVYDSIEEVNFVETVLKMDLNKTIARDGFINLPVDPGLDLVGEINRLKRSKHAVILGHYYINPEL